MKKKDRQELEYELGYKSHLGDVDTRRVIDGLVLLAHLGKQAEEQLELLKRDGFVDAPVIWVEPSNSLDDFKVQQTVYFKKWKLSPEMYPEFDNLKIDATIRRGDPRKSCTDGRAFTEVHGDLNIIGTGFMFEPTRGKIKKFEVSSRLMSLEVRLYNPEGKDSPQPKIHYWSLGCGSGHPFNFDEDATPEIDLKMLRSNLAYILVQQNKKRHWNYMMHLKQAVAARRDLSEWLLREQVCEGWLETIQCWIQSFVRFSKEVKYELHSVGDVMET